MLSVMTRRQGMISEAEQFWPFGDCERRKFPAEHFSAGRAPNSWTGMTAHYF